MKNCGAAPAIARQDLLVKTLYAPAAVSIVPWQEKLQLKYRRKATRIHVCWRATLLDPEDRRHRFHRDWAKEIPEAAAVLQQVDYATTRLT